MPQRINMILTTSTSNAQINAPTFMPTIPVQQPVLFNASRPNSSRCNMNAIFAARGRSCG